MFSPYQKVLGLLLMLLMLLAGTSKACCSFQYNNANQVRMLVPEIGYKRSFVVYFIPDNGSHENVIRCKWSKVYNCYPNSGYSWDVSDNKSILITFPANLPHGNFSLRIHKKSNDAHCICSWNPKESDGPQNTKIAFDDSSTTGQGQHDPEISGMLILGCVIAICCLLTGVAKVIWLYRKYDLYHKKKS